MLGLVHEDLIKVPQGICEGLGLKDRGFTVEPYG